eukprot:967243-Prorocentrum_minimum.AAC.1
MRSLRLVAVREYSQCGRSDWWGGHARQRTSSRWQMALKERSSTRRSGAPRSGPSCVIALSCQGARGASGDWCSSGEYTASARAIGARPGNIPPPIARRQQEACPRQGSRSRSRVYSSVPHAIGHETERRRPRARHVRDTYTSLSPRAAIYVIAKSVA